MASFDRTTEDIGNVVSLDHLNLTIVDQWTATLFYISGLGLTRDPYMMVSVDNMWLNAGHQQFHVPTSPDPQVVRGHVGIVVPDMDQLIGRLEEIRPRLQGTMFDYSKVDGYLDVTCPWGNHFHCTGPFPGFKATFGIPYIEFNVPVGTAHGIAHFYEVVLRAETSVADVSGHPAAIVRVGTDQSMVFRETPDENRGYDGHHVAVYLADFSGPHADLGTRALVTEESNEHQYRLTASRT